MDTDKGQDGVVDIRSRLVARDFKPEGEKYRGDVFAAMPPLEAKRILFAMAAKGKLEQWKGKKQLRKLMFIDVKKAHLNGQVPEEEAVCIELPMEAGSPGKYGLLKRWLYGMRSAASAWERDYTEKLEAVEFVRGKSAPTVFFRSRDGMRCVVHGDDFTFYGFDDELKEIKRKMEEHYEIKVRAVLSPEPGDDKEITILNRRLRWKDGRLEYEADPKHVAILCEAMRLTGDSKGATAAISKEDLMKDKEDGKKWLRKR